MSNRLSGNIPLVNGILFLFGFWGHYLDTCHQKTVAISTLKAEYIAVSEAGWKLLWIAQLFCELNVPLSNHPILLYDNDGARYTTNDPTNHSHAKHIDIQHHFIQ